ncbi:hypothetical protein BC829DRAFT_388345, partial [Chytridium lagenaria]
MHLLTAFSMTLFFFWWLNYLSFTCLSFSHVLYFPLITFFPRVMFFCLFFCAFSMLQDILFLVSFLLLFFCCRLPYV